MTIEEAQERILALEAENESLRTENGTLSQNNESVRADLEKARELNQKLFERVSAQSSDPDGGQDDEPDVPTCVEFAKTIII